MRAPALPLPEPLRAAEEPSFTHYSVVTRLPDIARRALQENAFPPQVVENIQALIQEIPYGKIRQVSADGPETADWQAWIAPCVGQNWLEVPWFFAEEYFYLRILEAAGYFTAGEGYLRDPYAAQKRLGLESERARMRALASDLEIAYAQPPERWPQTLARLLLADLWGNQSDLSLWPVQHPKIATGTPAAAAAHAPYPQAAEALEANGADPSGPDRVLANDLDPLLDYLAALDPAQTRVDLLLDNAGYELAADLALADYLLTTGRAAQVTLHAKSYPVFVSDAMEKDIFAALDYLVFEGQIATHALALRLRARLVDGRLRITHHNFWTSPLPMWQLPAGLLDDLSGADLLISKGDANYRRLLGDRHWPRDLAFSAVVDYLPCAVLALRTLKSEIAVGIPAGREPSAADPRWMINGRWGLVQFAPPAARP